MESCVLKYRERTAAARPRQGGQYQACYPYDKTAEINRCVVMSLAKVRFVHYAVYQRNMSAVHPPSIPHNSHRDLGGAMQGERGPLRHLPVRRLTTVMDYGDGQAGGNSCDTVTLHWRTTQAAL